MAGAFDGPTSETEPIDPEVDAEIRAAFGGLGLVPRLGARLTALGRGRAELTVDENGRVETGALAAIAECAGGIAVSTLLAAGTRCRVVEHKIDYASADLSGPLVAAAQVLRPGGSLSVARVIVASGNGAGGRTVAVLQATYLHGA